jgi:hypothetical protein
MHVAFGEGYQVRNYGTENRQALESRMKEDALALGKLPSSPIAQIEFTYVSSVYLVLKGRGRREVQL